MCQTSSILCSDKVLLLSQQGDWWQSARAGACKLEWRCAAENTAIKCKFNAGTKGTFVLTSKILANLSWKSIGVYSNALVTFPSHSQNESICFFWWICFSEIWLLRFFVNLLPSLYGLLVISIHDFPRSRVQALPPYSVPWSVGLESPFEVHSCRRRRTGR